MLVTDERSLRHHRRRSAGVGVLGAGPQAPGQRRRARHASRSRWVRPLASAAAAMSGSVCAEPARRSCAELDRASEAAAGRSLPAWCCCSAPVMSAAPLAHALAPSAAAAALDRRAAPASSRVDAPPRRRGRCVTDRPLAEIEQAPPGSAAFVLTHSHSLDFTLCSAVLERGDFAYLGLIGSATKRAKFERGFRELGIPRSGSPPWPARSAAPRCATSARR